jgi:hypothetical protein
MSPKIGQIIARGDSRWLIRVYLGRDRETGKRAYHNGASLPWKSRISRSK